MLSIYPQIIMFSIALSGVCAVVAMERKWTLKEVEHMLLVEPLVIQGNSTSTDLDNETAPMLDIDVEAIIKEHEPINPHLIIQDSEDFNEFIAALQIAKDMPTHPINVSSSNQLKQAISTVAIANQYTDLQHASLIIYYNQQLIDGIKEKNRGKIDQALKAGADINWLSIADDNPLLLAIKSDDKDICNLLFNDRKINVNLANAKGYTPLILAAVKGNREVAKQIIKNPSFDPKNISAKDEAGNTALHYAILARQTDMVKFLMYCGASLQLIKNKQGMHVIDYAYALSTQEVDENKKAVYKQIWHLLKDYLEERKQKKKQLT